MLLLNNYLIYHTSKRNDYSCFAHCLIFFFYNVEIQYYRCNSSYLEETQKITKLNAEKFGYTHANMVIVTEWEEFGALVRKILLIYCRLTKRTFQGELDSILTTYDREIDNASVHKGKQM